MSAALQFVFIDSMRPLKVLAIITREPQLFDAKERLRLPEENETLEEVTMLLPVDL